MMGLADAASLATDAATRREGHGWFWAMAGRVTTQGFYIAVTLFVFANIQDRSETITVALIGLVFASLRASALAGACAQRRVALLLENEIKSVRHAMARETPPQVIADAKLERSLEALTKLSVIDYAGLALIGAICLYHLAVTIIYGTAYQELLGLH